MDRLSNMLNLFLLQKMVQGCLRLTVKSRTGALGLPGVGCWFVLRLSTWGIARLSLGGRETRNVVRQRCGSQLLVVQRGQSLRKDQLLLQLLY